MMKPYVLVAWEESQAVTIEFRKFGIEAFSCDLQPCSGGHPEWHMQLSEFKNWAIKLGNMAHTWAEVLK
jgi:hypothetical protein